MRRALFLSEITGLLYFIYENMIVLTPLKTLHFLFFLYSAVFPFTLATVCGTIT